MANGLFTLKQQVQALQQGAWSGYIAPKWVEYLVVAGGGGAGGSNQNASGTGGGGGGGLLTGIVTVATGTPYTVIVGAGGAGGSGTSGIGQRGDGSSFGNIYATGGGGSQNAFASGTNIDGGSGAGSNNAKFFGTGTSGQGNQGGENNGTAPTYGTGGGGGAGTVGLNSGAGFAGNGGAGIASSISGTVVSYAGGGGGGLYSTTASAGSGGVGGGGAGGANASGTSGGGNTGGGAGAASGGSGSNVTLTGGSGGSGIVIVRYPGTVQFFTGGTLSYANGYIIHTFFASGTLAPTTPTVYIDTPYQISRSLRFNAADSNTLTRTPASSGSRTTYSLSFWIKNSFTSGSDNPVWGQSSIARESLAFQGFSYSHNPIQWIPFTGFEFRTTQAFRDNSAWYHIVAVGDSTNATASDRARLYVNGVRITAFDASATITQNAQTGQLNTAVLHYIGQTWSSDGAVPRYYLTEVNFIDGQALTPSAFGYTNPDTGVWAPHKFVGTYGTNGFYLKFADNSNTTAATLGADSSGNGNNWTPNGFSVTAGAGNDSMVDTPTQYGDDTGVGGSVRGNYATMNPLNATGAAATNGNLDITLTSPGTTIAQIRATIAPTSGKWYWENVITTDGNQSTWFGVVAASVAANANLSNAFNQVVYARYDGTKTVNGSNSAYGASYAAGDIIGVALDLDGGSITFYKNNASQGSISLPTSGIAYVPVYWWSSSTSAGAATFNFGQRPFAYTAPSGFKALCTQNLPTPTIGGSAATLANKYFDASLFTGRNIDTPVINSGFQPDLVWFKSRSNVESHYLVDVVRGGNSIGRSDTTAAELTVSGYLTFNQNGFTPSSAYAVTFSATYVGWQWKAGSTAVTNTSGSISSQVSANPTTGFSIVTYTGTGANATVGHGLGVAPRFIITKKRNSTSNWATNDPSQTNPWSGALVLNLTSAFTTSSAVWNDTAPTTTVFSIGTADAVNISSATYVAYCFAPVAGFSAFGSYTGNGSTDGPFIHTGFRPRWLMTKRTDSSTSGDWNLVDTSRGAYNAVGPYLYANQNVAEGNAAIYDILSNGFKIRETGAGTNANGSTYIYACFAENPFKHSLAR